MFSSSCNVKMICGLKIDTSVDEWHTSITKILKKIKGASYTIDAEEGMAYISGRGNATSFLRKLKASKCADICWVRAGNEITYAADPYNYEAMQPYSFHAHQPQLQLQPGYWSSSHYDPRLHCYPPQRPPMAGAYSYHDHHHHRPYGYWDSNRSMHHWA